jgi:quercetin dioxygenase-like cupin family protein
VQTFRIEDFTKGWIIGNFSPVVVKSKEFEIGMKFFSAGDTEPSHFQVIATEITLIASGEITINGSNFSSGDIILIEPGEVAEFKSLTDSKLFCIKFPSIPNDKKLK